MVDKPSTTMASSSLDAIGIGKEPVYDVRMLDRLVTRVAREVRLLEQGLKATNAKTTIEGYDQDDAVLGELS